MKKSLVLVLCLLSLAVAAQERDSLTVGTSRNNLRLAFQYNYNGSNEQYSSFDRYLVGSVLWAEYNRSLTNRFDLGVNIGIGYVAYRTYTHPSLTFNESTDLAYHFGLNAYYHFLPQYRSGYRSFDVYAVGRLGYSIGDKGYWEGSIGLGNEYFFNSHFGVSAEVGWGNNFFFKSNDWSSFGHVLLQCGVIYKF